MADPAEHPDDHTEGSGVAPGASEEPVPTKLPNGLVKLPEAILEHPENPLDILIGPTGNPEVSSEELLVPSETDAGPHETKKRKFHGGESPPKDRQCKAQSKQTGRQCGNWTLPGREVCRFHGGKTPRNIASPHYRGKGYSLDLPKPLREIYETAQSDSELLSMRNEAALLQVRLSELVKRLGTGEHGNLWAKLQEAWRRFQRAMKSGSDSELQAAIAEIGNTVERGVSTEKSWSEVCQMVDRKTTVAAREWRRLVDLQQTITADKAMTFITAIAWSVKTHCKDPVAQRAIAQDIMKLVNNSKVTIPAPPPEPRAESEVTNG